MKTHYEIKWFMAFIAVLSEKAAIRIFGRFSYRVGSFVVLWIATGLMLLLTLLTFGVNPTLILSVVAAPFWVVIVLICWRVSGWLTELQKNERKRDNKRD